MKNEVLDPILSILNGRGIDVKEYPEKKLITSPGFYFNKEASQIEHWSHVCPYNETMHSHFSNSVGLIFDGFRSILDFEDLEGLADFVSLWKKHLIRYGVEQ